MLQEMFCLPEGMLEGVPRRLQAILGNRRNFFNREVQGTACYRLRGETDE